MTLGKRATGLRDRITEYVVTRIASGEWLAGDRIPSELALAGLFAASRMTVHHALRDLAGRGFLVRRAGSGTFVAQPSAYLTEFPHLDIAEEIGARGGRHRAEVLHRALSPANPDQAATFSVADGTPLFHAVILHHEDDQPLELEDRLIAPRFLPGAMTIDLARQTLFARLMLVRPHREGSETVRAIIGSPREIELLRVDPGAPLIEVRRRTWSSDGVVTTARMLRPGDSARPTGRIRSLTHPATGSADRFR